MIFFPIRQLRRIRRPLLAVFVFWGVFCFQCFPTVFFSLCHATGTEITRAGDNSTEVVGIDPDSSLAETKDNASEITQEAKDATDSEDSAEETQEGGALQFTYNGFIEWESIFSTDTDQDFSDANKKNELRNRLEINYGTESRYLFSVTNLYLTPTFFNNDIGETYRYADETRMERNLRMSGSHYEIDFRELYLNLSSEKTRFRLGNQIYAWGTADVFNPTSYFNTLDYREFIFRDDDEDKSSVPSLSAMLFMDDYTLETVFMPVHVPMLLAPSGNFWYLNIQENLYTAEFLKTNGMQVEMENVGIGTRLSSSYRGADFSLSAFHGPDRDAIFTPVGVSMTPNQTLSLQLDPQYFVVNMLGADFSATINDFVIQFELAYSPDKHNLVEQNMNQLQQITFPFESRKSQYFAYAVGFNYFIPLTRLIESHEGETVFTFEWYQSKFFEEDVYQAYLTDIISCKLEDTYYQGHIPVSIKTLFDTRSNSSVFWPKVGYDFQNGWLIELSYAAIDGKKDNQGLLEPMFYYFRDNDILMGSIRYDY
ncbi:MAG: hypothetical protein C0403_08520 [Desulfobacterium sp.]|nr:hypothetical protein [Desulfobacterium sp.]